MGDGAYGVVALRLKESLEKGMKAMRGAVVRAECTIRSFLEVLLHEQFLYLYIVIF